MILGFRRHSEKTPRSRVQIDTDNSVVYAVGDIHGCYGELVSLEGKIVADARQFSQPKIIVMLGDYVDRGNDSRRVLDHLCEEAPEGFQRICLAGNHDVAMLDYLEGRLTRDIWLGYGGRETLFSYGLDPAYLAHVYKEREVDRFIRANIPASHVQFLRGLPILASSQRYVFVHAGMRAGLKLQDQQDDDLAGITNAFPDGADELNRWVIHGHTRVAFPRAKGRTLSLDTGAYVTGRLTAVRFVGKRGRLLFS